MKNKKSLGQNFLRSKGALGAMVDAGDPTANDMILEIGPGEGVLTEKLLALAGKVIAVEKDHRLIPHLKEKFKKEIEAGRFDLVEKDILEFDTSLLNFYTHPYKIIANIPYYITGQILKMFLGSENPPQSMTLLLQKEVAERIVAKNKKESLLSVSVKIFGTPKYIKTVGRGAFVPPPKVDSAIISIRNINKTKFDGLTPLAPLNLRGEPEKKFFEIVRAGFAHKRKFLFGNLVSRGTLDTSKMKEVFEKCGVAEKARAEDLKIEDWVCLTRELM